MAAEASAGPVDLLERLTGLIEHLRAFEFKLSLEDELRLLTLRDEIYRRGGSATKVEELARIVSPLVCRNPDEQERLPPILERWASIAAQPKEGGRVKAPEIERRPRRTWTRLLILGVVLLCVTIAFWLGGDTTGTNTTGPVEGPVAPGEERAPTPSVYWTQVMRDLLALLPFAAALLFYWLRPRSTALARGRAPRDAAARALDIAVADSPLFRPGAVQASLRDLRRHRQVPSNDLDVGRTVAATARRAGFVEFVRGRRYILPDYLLLTDRTSSVDHFGDLGEVLAARLQAEQFRVTRGEYFGDPRRISLIRPDGSRDRRELDRLAGEQPDMRLLLIADVADFWDPIKQQWRQWVSGLEAFGATAVLTPVPRAQWGERERALIERGFLVVAATSDGLGDLAQQLRAAEATGHRVAHGSDEAERLERLLAGEPYRWLDDVPPPPAEIAALVSALRDTLDEGAFLHLCAIAVFPALNPRLTEQVGALLTLGDGSPAMTEQGYVAMARLPWLRRSRLPDWLRKALIETMRPEDSARVRALWVGLLARDPGPTSQGVAFEVVAPEPGRGAVRALLRSLRGGQEGELAERLMLAFLADRKLPDLSFEIPGRLWSRRSVPIPAPADWAAFVLALLAGAAWLQWGYLAAAAADRAAALLPETVRQFAGPLLTVATLALGALGESRRASLLSARLLSPFAVAAGALPVSLSPAVATIFMMAGLGAAAYAWSSPGLRHRMMTGVNPRRLAAGDRAAVTAFVLLTTFGGAAAVTGAGVAALALEERAWLWPAALASDFILIAFGVLWFARRIEAPPRFALTTAAAAVSLSAIAAGLATAFLMVIQKVLPIGLWPGQPVLFAATVTIGIPWAVGLVLLFGRLGWMRRQAAAAAMLLLVKLTIVWFRPQTDGSFDAFSDPLGLLVMALPLPLILGLMGAAAADLRRRGLPSHLSLLTLAFLSAVLLGDEIYMVSAASTVPEESAQAWIAFSIWGAGGALSWLLLRGLVPGLVEAGSAEPGSHPGTAPTEVPFRERALRLLPFTIPLLCLGGGTEGIYTSLPPLLVPLILYLCWHHEWRRVRLWVAVGALPLIVGAFVSFRAGMDSGPLAFSLGSNPGLYVLLLLLPRFVGDADYRRRCREASRFTATQIAFLVIALGAEYNLELVRQGSSAGSFGVLVPWDFTILLIALCLSIGYSDIRRRRLAGALAAGAAVSVALMGEPEVLDPLHVYAVAATPAVAIACLLSLVIGRALRSGRPLLAGRDDRPSPDPGLFAVWALALLPVSYLAFAPAPLPILEPYLLFPLAILASRSTEPSTVWGTFLLVGIILVVIAVFNGTGEWQPLSNGFASVDLSVATIVAKVPLILAACLVAEILRRRLPPAETLHSSIGEGIRAR